MLGGAWRKMTGEGFSMNSDLQLQDMNGIIEGFIYEWGSNGIRIALQEDYYYKGLLDGLQREGAG